MSIEGQAQLSSQSHGDSSVRKGKATWNEWLLDAFLRVCIQEVRNGNRPSTHFNKIGWKNVVKNFNANTGKNYDYKQLKNKLDGLKKEWQVWEKLVGKETGLGWDFQRKTVQASEKWWNRKLQEIPEAAKFRERGLQFAEDMEILFKDVVATGEQAWAPSSGMLPNDNMEAEEIIGEQINMEELNDMEVDGNDINLDEIPSTARGDDDSSSHTKKRKRHKSVNHKEKNKETTSATIRKAFDKIAKVMEVHTCRSASIESVMSIVCQLPGAERGSHLWYKVTNLMTNKAEREMFMTIKEPELQLDWLKWKTNYLED